MAPPRVNNKKVKSDKGNDKKEDKVEKTTEDTSDEGSNSGFGAYLKSEQGMGFMKMFVMMNSLVMLLTMGVPAMKQAYEVIYTWLEEYELV